MHHVADEIIRRGAVVVPDIDLNLMRTSTDPSYELRDAAQTTQVRGVNDRQLIDRVQVEIALWAEVEVVLMNP